MSQDKTLTASVVNNMARILEVTINDGVAIVTVQVGHMADGAWVGCGMKRISVEGDDHAALQTLMAGFYSTLWTTLKTNGDVDWT